MAVAEIIVNANSGGGAEPTYIMGSVNDGQTFTYTFTRSGKHIVAICSSESWTQVKLNGGTAMSVTLYGGQRSFGLYVTDEFDANVGDTLTIYGVTGWESGHGYCIVD